jgi:hypothetical protein
MRLNGGGSNQPPSHRAGHKRDSLRIGATRLPTRLETAGWGPWRASLKSFAERLCGELSLARTPTAEGIRQYQKLVESGVTRRGNRGGLVQRSKCNATHCAAGARPHQNRFGSRRDDAPERSGRIQSGNSSRQCAPLSRKGILPSVNEKFFHRRKVWAVQ